MAPTEAYKRSAPSALLFQSSLRCFSFSSRPSPIHHPQELLLVFNFGDEVEEEQSDPLTEDWADYEVDEEVWRQKEAERERRIWDPPSPGADAGEWQAWADAAGEWLG